MSDADLLIKRPMFQIINTETKQEISQEYLARIGIFDYQPTIWAHENLMAKQLTHSISRELFEYVKDSLARHGIAIDELGGADIHGFEFIGRRSKIVRLLDLTVLTNRFRGEFAICAHYDTVLFDYRAKYVPDFFKGYHKTFEEIKFDTLFIKAEGPIKKSKQPFSVH